MNSFNESVICIIKDALTGSGCAKSVEEDFSAVYNFAKKQQITDIVYLGLQNNQKFAKDEVYSDFTRSLFINVSYSEKQLYEIENVSNAFKRNDINYVLLKGGILKRLYPATEMREMGDIDILIKEKEYGKIRKVMQSLGFEEKYGSNHEHVWDKGTVSIELHKMLIPSYNKDYYSYFGDGWKLVKNGELSDEDFYIYIFTHFAKHYRDKGVGVKYVIDLYVYKNAKKLDFNYIERQLKILKLYEFHANITRLLNVWFNGEESDEKTDFITEILFSGGVYGNAENAKLSQGVKTLKKTKHLKLSRTFRAIFPNFDGMRTMYPILGKLPILLPFMWIVRIFSKLFTKGKVKKAVSQINDIDKEKIDKYEQDLKYVGLDYDFK